MSPDTRELHFISLGPFDGAHGALDDAAKWWAGAGSSSRGEDVEARSRRLHVMTPPPRHPWRLPDRLYHSRWPGLGRDRSCSAAAGPALFVRRRGRCRAPVLRL